MHRRSIFRKQLLLYIGMLLVSVMLLGALLSVLLTDHYMREKKEQLIWQGQKLSKEYTEAYFTGSFEEFAREMKTVEEYLRVNFFFINRDGILIMASPKIPERWIGQALARPEVVQGVLDGKAITLEGRFSGVFEEPVLTVGYPLQVGQMAGIFLTTSMPEIEESLHDMYWIGGLSLLVVMCIGSFFAYFSSQRITKPILALVDAAKTIAQGNYENRVELESNDEMQTLAESFNHMAESISLHENHRRQFVANVSHDLRSPLTSIQGFLTAILDGTIPPEKEKHYLGIILEETKRLTKLTNDIVDLSRAQESALIIQRTSFDLHTLIRDVLEQVQGQLLTKDIRVEAVFAGQEALVFADRDKIARVVYNLLDNAQKFSPAGGQIEIETAFQDEKTILVHIRDHGIGIPAEAQAHIFDRFFKADSSRGEYKTGSGLGLSIVREFLAAHGETITLKSTVGEGSDFIFSLKRA